MGLEDIMAKISIFAEPSFPANIDKIVEHLNRMPHYIKFRAGDMPILFAGGLINQVEADDQLPPELKAATEKDLRAILFTQRAYSDNYFYHSVGNRVIISLSDWPYLTNMPINNGIVYFIANIIAHQVNNDFRHKKTTGCIYDFKVKKRAIDLGMRNAFVCPDCLQRIFTSKLTQNQLQYLHDLRFILNDLGSASKWNEDIVDYWENSELEEVREEQEQLDDLINVADFIPDDDTYNYIDITNTTMKDLLKSYVYLMDPNLSIVNKGPALEQFAKHFFGIIKGWKLEETNHLLPDCEIDLIWDIVGGPEKLKERIKCDLIFMECKNLKSAVTARHISHFAANLITHKIRTGIFISSGGITGYNPMNWKSASKGAYKLIIDLHKSNGTAIIPFVGEDIEAVKNGANLAELLEKKCMRLHMV